MALVRIQLLQEGPARVEDRVINPRSVGVGDRYVDLRNDSSVVHAVDDALDTVTALAQWLWVSMCVPGSNKSSADTVVCCGRFLQYARDEASAYAPRSRAPLRRETVRFGATQSARFGSVEVCSS